MISIIVCSIDKNKIGGFVKKLFETENLEYKYKNKYTLFSIDAISLNVRFFRDPDMEDAIYTLENIPPKNIKAIGSYDINKDGYITSSTKYS